MSRFKIRSISFWGALILFRPLTMASGGTVSKAALTSRHAKYAGILLELHKSMRVRCSGSTFRCEAVVTTFE